MHTHSLSAGVEMKSLLRFTPLNSDFSSHSHNVFIIYAAHITHHDDDNNHEVCCVNVESRYAELQSTVENEKSNFHFSCAFLLLSLSLLSCVVNTFLYRREFTCVESHKTKTPFQSLVILVEWDAAINFNGIL